MIKYWVMDEKKPHYLYMLKIKWNTNELVYINKNGNQGSAVGTQPYNNKYYEDDGYRLLGEFESEDNPIEVLYFK